jgi:hypothetical protein
LAFTQEVACGYKETVEILGTLPEFVTFNEETNDFTVFTEDIAHAGIFPLTVRATIEVPVDHTSAEVNSYSTEVQFELEVVAACDSTFFVDWNLSNEGPTQVNVLGETGTVALGPVEDSVSRESGNQDGLTFCGERAYRIVSTPPFIAMGSDAKSLIISSTKESEIGQHQVQVEVSLVDQPTIT